MPEVRVNGVDLSYIDDGVGTPVVFVHGAWMDLRYWEPQREGVAAHHRFVAYTLRYHGTAPWPDDGKNYSAATHAADLASGLHTPVERRPRASRRALHGRAPSHDGRARTFRSFAELDGTRT